MDLPLHIIKLSKKWYHDTMQHKYIHAGAIGEYIKKRKADQAQTKLNFER